MSLYARAQRRTPGDDIPRGGALVPPPAQLTPRAVAAPDSEHSPVPVGSAEPVSGQAAAQTGAGGTAPSRPAGSPLLTRTGLQRTGFGKLGALQTQYVTLRGRVHQRLVEELADADNTSQEVIVNKLHELVGEVAAELSINLTRQDRQRVVEQLTNDVLGLGPLEALLADVEVSEIMI